MRWIKTEAAQYSNRSDPSLIYVFRDILILLLQVKADKETPNFFHYKWREWSGGDDFFFLFEMNSKRTLFSNICFFPCTQSLFIIIFTAVDTSVL